MKTVANFSQLLIVFLLLIGFFTNSFAESKNRERGTSNSNNFYEDCDDKLAKCGDKCNAMKTWMWWKKKECERNCEKAYYKCLEEEN